MADTLPVAFDISLNFAHVPPDHPQAYNIAENYVRLDFKYVGSPIWPNMNLHHHILNDSLGQPTAEVASFDMQHIFEKGKICDILISTRIQGENASPNTKIQLKPLSKDSAEIRFSHWTVNSQVDQTFTIRASQGNNIKVFNNLKPYSGERLRHVKFEMEQLMLTDPQLVISMRTARY
jgi:hypothetical protein